MGLILCNRFYYWLATNYWYQCKESVCWLVTQM